MTSWLGSAGGGGGNSGGGGGGSNDAYQQAALQAMQMQSQLLQQMMARQAEADALRKQRGDALYGTLLTRSQQGLGVKRGLGPDGVDPNQHIWDQVDNFAANQERSRRDYLSDLAESEGPLANLRGEQRMAAEGTGLNTANFQSELVGREIMTRREEIQNALLQMGDMLSGEQVAALQRELGMLDNAIKQQQVGLGSRGLDLDQLRTELLNRQFYDGLQSENDRFTAQLGFNRDDRARYWDMEMRKFGR